MHWPFPMDQWGKGKAFRCKAADCGTEVTVYVRAKIGFCNCTTGVSDDEELDRISDFDLLGDKLAALGPRAADRGRLDEGPQPRRSRSAARSRPASRRSRSASTTTAMRSSRPRCWGTSNRPRIEPAVLEFLNSKTVVHWAEVTLGL